jgi:hypothetical protein
MQTKELVLSVTTERLICGNSVTGVPCDRYIFGGLL